MSRQIKKYTVRKCTPDMAVDDEANVEHAIEKRQERSEDHEGGSGEARRGPRREDARRSSGKTRVPFSRAEGHRVVHGALIDRHGRKPCHRSSSSVCVKNWNVRLPRTWEQLIVERHSDVCMCVCVGEAVVSRGSVDKTRTVRWWCTGRCG